MKNVSIAAMTVTLSCLMLAAGCVGADVPEDIAQDDGVAGDITLDDIAQDDGVGDDNTPEDIAQDDGAIGEAQSALASYPPGGPASIIGTCGRYCVYALNGDSTLSAGGCSDSEAEAQAYRDSFTSWKLVAAFDTIRNGVPGWVKFLIKDNLPCTASRTYQIPDLSTLPCNHNDIFVNATGNSWSGCGRIRVWEHVNFDGYSMACSSTAWCPDLIDGALDLTQRVSSWRAIYQ